MRCFPDKLLTCAEPMTLRALWNQGFRAVGGRQSGGRVLENRDGVSRIRRGEMKIRCRNTTPKGVGGAIRCFGAAIRYREGVIRCFGAARQSVGATIRGFGVAIRHRGGAIRCFGSPPLRVGAAIRCFDAARLCVGATIRCFGVSPQCVGAAMAPCLASLLILSAERWVGLEAGTAGLRDTWGARR